MILYSFVALLCFVLCPLPRSEIITCRSFRGHYKTRFFTNSHVVFWRRVNEKQCAISTRFNHSSPSYKFQTNGTNWNISDATIPANARPHIAKKTQTTLNRISLSIQLRETKAPPSANGDEMKKTIIDSFRNTVIFRPPFLFLCTYNNLRFRSTLKSFLRILYPRYVYILARKSTRYCNLSFDYTNTRFQFYSFVALLVWFRQRHPCNNSANVFDSPSILFPVVSEDVEDNSFGLVMNCGH